MSIPLVKEPPLQLITGIQENSFIHNCRAKMGDLYDRIQDVAIDVLDNLCKLTSKIAFFAGIATVISAATLYLNPLTAFNTVIKMAAVVGVLFAVDLGALLFSNNILRPYLDRIQDDKVAELVRCSDDDILSDRLLALKAFLKRVEISSITKKQYEKIIDYIKEINSANSDLDTGALINECALILVKSSHLQDKMLPDLVACCS